MRRLLASLAALSMLAAGCGGTGEPADSRVPRPADTSPVSTSPATTSPATTSPVTTSGSIAVDPALVAAPDDVATSPAIVLRVIDGDSLEVDIDGADTELRLIGINAPEGDECHGDSSRDTLDAIVASAGDTIEVAEGAEGRDQFGRLLGYASAEGVDINALLVATGNALALQSGHSRQERYLSLSEAAFAEGAGMWGFGVCGAATITDGDVRIVAVEPDPPGRDEERLGDELVVIENTSERTIDLSGWTLRDDSTANRYLFPADATLDAGAELTISVGCGTDDDRTRYWCSDRPVWSNGGDSVLLLDASGNVVDLFVYRG